MFSQRFISLVWAQGEPTTGEYALICCISEDLFNLFDRQVVIGVDTNIRSNTK